MVDYMSSSCVRARQPTRAANSKGTRKNLFYVSGFRGARFERVALAIQRRQEEREYHRLAALGLVPPGVSLSDYRDQLRSSTSSREDHQHHRDVHGA